MMNKQTPRAGDRALVLQAPGAPQLVNEVVSVLSDTYVCDIFNKATRKASIGVLVNDVQFPAHASPGPYPISMLLRIPPDDEARQLFGEREKEAA